MLSVKLPGYSSNGYCRKIFKIAKVVPILKPGKNAKSPTSYSRINILNCLDKVFEEIVLQRIFEYTETNNTIQNEQFGFRNEHTAVHHVKRIVNFISNNKSPRKSN